jgi:tetratricopeptide (TPR) repeat protein
MKPHRLVAIVLLSWGTALVAPLAGQEHHHHAHDAVGHVNFAVTCSPAVRDAFTRAVALLHSFQYEDSRQVFSEVAREDPACGMAHWGVAMTYYHPLWAPPTPAEFEHGRAAASRAAELGAKSPREQRYIAAIGAFYGAPDHRARALAYKSAMERVAAEFPDDEEARIFHALSLLGTAPPSDTTYAQQKQAAEILNGLLTAHAQHPGILHYLIHAFDYPELARLALDAARTYARVAPDSSHALHMPSHIFTRLGLWDDSIASNLDSAAAADAQVARTHPGLASFEAVHALDYLAYAYLQLGDDGKAREVVEEVGRSRRFDDPNIVAAYALAAIPARYALERRDWRAAAELDRPAAELPWDDWPHVRAITAFANAIGAARSRNLARARQSLNELEQLQDALKDAPPAGPYDWAGQVTALRLAAAGWTAFAEGRQEKAVRLLEQGARKEEKVGKHPVTPGAILPAAELLGDLLLELGRPADALAAYDRSLAEAPKRFNSLAGAAKAAKKAGKPELARRYYEDLVSLCREPCDRPEVKEGFPFLTGS